MKSTIKIEMDYESMTPCIEIKKVLTEDTRDGLLHHFTRSFFGSPLARIKFHYLNETDRDNRIECLRIWALDEKQAKIEALKLIFPTILLWLKDYKAIVEQEEGKWKDNFASLQAEDYLEFYNEGYSPREAYEENKSNS